MRYLLDLIKPVCPHCAGSGGFVDSYPSEEWSGCSCCNADEDNEADVTRLWRWQWWLFCYRMWQQGRWFDRMAAKDELKEKRRAAYLAASRPAAFLEWATEIFGKTARNTDERTLRFVEEAIEVAHARGIPGLTLQLLTARVYSKAAGQFHVELGQAALTLEGLAENFGVSASEAAQREFDRVRAIPKESWEERHAAKVAKGIAL